VPETKKATPAKHHGKRHHRAHPVHRAHRK